MQIGINCVLDICSWLQNANCKIELNKDWLYCLFVTCPVTWKTQTIPLVVEFYFLLILAYKSFSIPCFFSSCSCFHSCFFFFIVSTAFVLYQKVSFLSKFVQDAQSIQICWISIICDCEISINVCRESWLFDTMFWFPSAV